MIGTLSISFLGENTEETDRLLFLNISQQFYLMFFQHVTFFQNVPEKYIYILKSIFSSPDYILIKNPN